MRIAIAAALALIPAAAAWAAERPVAIAPGAGRDLVESNCQACHSLDYIVMNSPFLDREGWRKEVVKMVEVFGAPVGKPDQDAIIAYLAEHYGGAQTADNPIMGR